MSRPVPAHLMQQHELRSTHLLQAPWPLPRHPSSFCLECEHASLTCLLLSAIRVIPRMLAQANAHTTFSLILPRYQTHTHAHAHSSFFQSISLYLSHSLTLTHTLSFFSISISFPSLAENLIYRKSYFSWRLLSQLHRSLSLPNTDQRSRLKGGHTAGVGLSSLPNVVS